MFQKICQIEFPEPQNININMMPIIMGDQSSIPNEFKQYWSLIKHADFEDKSIVYLTINERWVTKGVSQRRPGQHTDATSSGKHGGGRHGGQKNGIYIASSDGNCQAWQTDIFDVDHLGELKTPFQEQGERFAPNTLYVMNDTTPHESLIAEHSHFRQFFRLTGPDLSIWWAQHNTPNPLGVKADALIKHENKF